ncbi:filamentous hemagglutinin N-terminal domain-containing protein [Nostoc sp. UHCC 0251]|uniref:two-partner secretion domain-containing protein n=1 Tax=Nostoc sp. UHCC 0251 TaxID=3110240 RepID=UPI002B2122A3|nr:filamentous hemagglutinin N-terminal domain-containing protein [Nostoc sp. UHCC 0251]MEA5623666.1 filamentous hemagglutinin N-terminal domain-containing protein [Nostoc sp. UHCC 0251]
MSLRSWFGRGCHLGLPCLVIIVGAIGIRGGDCTSAQITPDPSVGTQVERIDDTTLDITGGTTVGNTNLFHSFRNFSITSEEVVNFQNASTINNILVRVTGINPSDIQGTLQTQGNANFFLMNPNGIIFGGNAALNIGGSFIGTTASAIQFPGGGEFSITSPVSPLNPLLRVNPSAFLINQIPSQPVKPIQVNEAFIFVPESQSLVLLGGDVNLEGAIVFAQDGRIELGGLAAEGTVGLNIDNNNFRLSFPESVARADVSLSNFTTVSASGEGGGGIQIQGRRVTFDSSEIGVNTLFSKSGGTLGINASESVELLGGSRLLTETTNSGTAGELRIETGRLIVQDGSQISASTSLESTGGGGTLFVNARDSIQLIGTSPIIEGEKPIPSGLFTVTQGAGNAGELKIETGQLIVQDGAQVSASTSLESTGGGGTLSVNARDSIQLIGTNGESRSGLFVGTQATGNAGSLNIETGQLIVQNGARISASTSTESTGDGGTLSVNARDSIQLIGTSQIGASGLFVGTESTGNAGNLNIETGNLIVQDGAQVSANTLSQGTGGTLSVNARDSIQLIGTSQMGASGLFVGTESTGNAGNLNIETGNLIVQDGAQVSASTSQESTGEGGSIIVKTGELNVLNNADITVSSQGTKKAGDLEITARSIKLDDQGKLIGQANSGDGGNITLNLQDLLLLRRNSEISTSAGTRGAGGNGGNITINVPDGFIVAKPNENSDITANAFSGSGGRATIKATQIFGIASLTEEDLKRLRPKDLDPRQLQTNDITAISQTRPNLSGIVEINTLDVDPSQGLINLPAVPVDTQVSQACQVRPGENQNSFTITGRGGLPPNPRTEPLTPDAVQLDWVTLNPKGENRVSTNVSNQVNSSSPAPIVEAQGWVINTKGEVVLTADAPKALAHSSWFTPASCS